MNMESKIENENMIDGRIKYMKKIINMVFNKFPSFYLIGSAADSFKVINNTFVFTGENVRDLDFVIDPKLSIQAKLYQILKFQNFFEDKRVSWSQSGYSYGNFSVLKGTFVKLPIYFEIDILFNMNKGDYDYLWDIQAHRFGINKLGVKCIWGDLDVKEYKAMLSGRISEMNSCMYFSRFRKNLKKDGPFIIKILI